MNAASSSLSHAFSGIRRCFPSSSTDAVISSFQFSLQCPCEESGYRVKWEPAGSCIRMAAVVNYSPPWWVNLLHRMPHFNIEFQMVSSDFRPEDSEYQKVRQVRENNYLPLRNSSSPSSCSVTSSSYRLPLAHTVISQQSGQVVTEAILQPELWVPSQYRSALCVCVWERASKRSSLFLPHHCYGQINLYK